MRNFLFQQSNLSILNPILEQKCFNTLLHQWPRDIAIPNWSFEGILAICVTISSRPQALVFSKATVEHGVAVYNAEEHKFVGYGAQFEEEGVLFIPLALDTSIGLGLVVKKRVLRQLAINDNLP